MAAGGAGGSATSGATGGTSEVGGAGGTGTSPANLHPLIDVLPLFTAPGVPARGPMESPAKPITNNGPVPVRPGDGQMRRMRMTGAGT